MKCKKCGEEINNNYYSCSTTKYLDYYKKGNSEVPEILSMICNEHHKICFCEKCKEFIDYKDMPIDMFLDWLCYSSESGDSRMASGKAFVRYFELDKLLEPKKDAGDLIYG